METKPKTDTSGQDKTNKQKSPKRDMKQIQTQESNKNITGTHTQSTNMVIKEKENNNNKT